MRGFYLVLCIVLVFTLGWFSSSLFKLIDPVNLEKPFSVNTLLNGNFEKVSPSDHLEEEKIHVYSDRIVIDLQGASWSTFADTNSMDPLLDKGTNGIEVAPGSTADIQIGDVISFNSNYSNGIIIHRVVEIAYDEKGWYARTKGDNNPTIDPGKVRFDDINGVLVGVIY